jgi:hypothetical protein
MSDPILSALGVRVRRVAIFVGLTPAIGLGLWLWLLLGKFDKDWQDWRGLLELTQTAWSGADLVGGLFLRGCLIISVQAMLVVYLGLALWWRRSGDVHRRGTRFIDRRED